MLAKWKISYYICTTKRIEMSEEIYYVKLKHNLYNIVYGEKITVPRGEIILDNIPESKLKFIDYPLVARDHGNGIKTLAQETDCITEKK